MSNRLWFPRIVDIGESIARPGRPATRLIDYSVCTIFPISDAGLAALRGRRWVEEANRRHGLYGLQVLVRVDDLPRGLSGANSYEALRASIAGILGG